MRPVLRLSLSVCAALLVIVTVLLGTVFGVVTANVTITPIDFTPATSGNFTATSAAGGTTSVSVMGAETGPSSSGSGDAADSQEVSGSITGLPPGVTGQWSVTFSADLRMQVSVLNYQTGSGGYWHEAWGGVFLECAAAPSNLIDSNLAQQFAEDHATVACHARLDSVGFTVNGADISLMYALWVTGQAHVSRPEVTATSWATTWSPVSATMVAWDNTGTPVSIQAFTLE